MSTTRDAETARTMLNGLRLLVKTAPALILFICISGIGAEQSDLWMDEGLKILKEKPDSLVQAAGLFAKAAEAYEAKGDQKKAAEANSCLYWTRKKFTIRETGIIVKGNPAAAQRMEKIISEKPKEEDAQGYLDRAESFAKESKDPLLTAIRYFEVADRFPTMDQGRKAMDASLKSMQQISFKDQPVIVEKKEKIDDAKLAQLIVGKWEIHWTNSGGSGAQQAEFFANGKVKVTVPEQNMKFDASWKIENGLIIYKTPNSISKLRYEGNKLDGTSSDGGTRSGRKN